MDYTRFYEISEKGLISLPQEGVILDLFQNLKDKLTQNQRL